MPLCDAFQFQSFEEIKFAFSTAIVAKYAHCVVAQPIDVSWPSFVLFVFGTDATSTSKIITQRWTYINAELKKRNITVISNGEDVAGPFLKAIVEESRLFKKLMR